MSATVRFTLAVVVVGAGLAAAGWWPASERPSPESRTAETAPAAAETSDSPPGVVSELAAASVDVINGPTPEPTLDEAASEPFGFGPGPRAGTVATRGPAEAAPVDMPRTNPLAAAEALTALERPRGPAAATASLSGEADEGSSMEAGDEVVAAAPTGPRIHEIKDGDTLVELAERYLGDGRRYLDIYEENRHLLPSPDVLPIGVRIVVPVEGGLSTGPPELPSGLLRPLQRRPSRRFSQ